MADEEHEDSFDIKGLIGQGAFGKVFLIENKEGKQFALKVVQILGRHPKEVLQTLQEVKLLADLEHDHILQYVEASKQGVDLWIITEFCPHGDIGGYLKRNQGTAMEESRLLLWIRQIADALQYLHGHKPKVIHRDLKNDNIFLDANWNTKLGDFGIARILEGPTSLAQTQCGTPLYMSPEICAGIPYTEKTDIFSLGIMMYEMSHMDKGMAPFQMVLFKIIGGTLPTMPTEYSEGVTQLMTSMMNKKPEDRPSATQILENDVFKTAPKPSPIESGDEGPDIEEIDEDDEDRRTILGTLTQLDMCKFEKGGGGAANMGGMSMIAEEGDADYFADADDDDDGDYETGVDIGSDEFEANPIMSLVYRTLTDMGKNTHKVQGNSMLQKQAEMLRDYCLQCLDNDEEIFKEASKALDANMDEDELEELLIRILGHERYAMCGAELLYYKNFTFNLRQD